MMESTVPFCKTTSAISLTYKIVLLLSRPCTIIYSSTPLLVAVVVNVLPCSSLVALYSKRLGTITFPYIMSYTAFLTVCSLSPYFAKTFSPWSMPDSRTGCFVSETIVLIAVRLRTNLTAYHSRILRSSP